MIHLRVSFLRRLLIHILVEVAAPHDGLARVLNPGEGAVRVDPVPVGDLEELLEHLLRRVAVQTLVDFQIQTEIRNGFRCYYVQLQYHLISRSTR